ncbi:sporulation related protein [Breznakibacter xylanolyticus]|uniref:Sporulation related protein n=1 Tax=Breznakibacter xylanolyticus TaxID=990 RepID=A0A2W7N0R5_9BACT|nr:SPOR domain-containing protein [Breznakibacter xylanolyticus]PZX13551.1 sporulation related protein [Breznakibacter xylanolyticus]
MLKGIRIIFIFLLIASSLQAQNITQEQAHLYFKNGNYSEAAKAYEQLFRLQSRDARINFFYGASLVHLNSNLSQAAKCLRYAVMRNVNKESLFYLGRASQLNYEYDEALLHFNKFITQQGIDAAMKSQTLQYIQECQFGKSMITKIYHPEVLSADTIDRGSELEAYQLSPDAGKIMKNSDFFESGIDPDGIVFATERGDVVYFTMSSANQHDLYKMERLIDGWSEATRLSGEINSDSEERYPFLCLDGITLYFSSNRPGGFGGYDIYKAVYDTQKKHFSEITNLGVPFNSPMDDYFFAPDEFNKTATFTSNRATDPHQCVVHTIAWTDQLIRSNISDINEVKVVAAMPLSEKGMQMSQENIKNKTNIPAKYANALFRFQIADTLEYTQYEQFQSLYALESFKKGFSQEQKRDSLAQQMTQMRQRYAASISEEERNKYVNEILRLESQTYGIGDGIERLYYDARKYEQDKIRELIRLGKYRSDGSTRIEGPTSMELKPSNIPPDLTIYSDDDRGRELAALKSVYLKFFHADDAARLLQADSMYVWGNMLNIESSRMLEKAYQPVEQPVQMPRPFQNKEDIATEETQGQILVNEARQQRENALKLYHQAFDTKYAIYAKKYSEMSIFSLSNQEHEKMMLHHTNASSQFKKAQEQTSQALLTLDINNYETAGAMKRKAVAEQESGLFYLKQVLDARSTQEDSTPTLQTDTSNEVVDNTVATPQQIITQDTPLHENLEQPEFRIQIGAFRKRPDATALAQLPDITTEVIDAGNVTKYFTGRYKTYLQASNALSQVKEAGFPGAFIVSFLNQKQIPVSKARELEPKN